MQEIELGIIGGSGLYNMANLLDIEVINLDTPFGKPSDSITIGTLHNRRIAFLPRHGRGHTLMPTEVPYRANIFALKLLGVKYLVSISACGSLREDYALGHIVIPDQLLDFTKKREYSFFGQGLVAHISIPQPFSKELGKALGTAVSASGGIVHEGGSFITIEGPRFSTQGESNLFRQWGVSIIGMTTSPEAFLAAEAEIAYAVMAHVTDYDVWHGEESPVTVGSVVSVLESNTNLTKKAISNLVEHMDQWEGDLPAHHLLQSAVLTDPSRISKNTIDALRPLVGKYLS